MQNNPSLPQSLWLWRQHISVYSCKLISFTIKQHKYRNKKVKKTHDQLCVTIMFGTTKFLIYFACLLLRHKNDK